MSVFQIHSVFPPNSMAGVQGIEQNSLIKQAAHAISEKISQLAYVILLPLNLIFNSPQATVSLLKKINRNILPLFESLKDLPLSMLLESSISLITSVQIAAGIDYVINKKYINDSIQSVAGNVALFISNAIDTLMWMLRIAGNIHLVSMISRFGGNILMNGSLAISHFLFSTDAFCRSIRTDQTSQRNYLKIELVKHATECVLALGAIGSALSPQSMGLLAALGIGMELTSLIYKDQNLNDL